MDFVGEVYPAELKQGTSNVAFKQEGGVFSHVPGACHLFL